VSDDRSWYSDGDQLLTELKRGRRDRMAAPSIAGYEDFELLGHGGQGVVFSATQRSTRRRVAVKVLLDGTFASPAARRRFEREIELVAALEHPGIVRVFDSGTTEDGRLYAVTELLPGLPLDKWMAGHRAESAPQREAWIRDRTTMVMRIGEAVHHAHQRGVIHRDLKPGNVRVDPEGRPHVLDFGLAKSIAPEAVDASRAVSVAGEFFGSIPWSSPEQLDGAVDRVDVRSDVYSLGVLAYQALTEAMPYEVGSNLSSALRAVQAQVPAAPTLLGRPLERDLATILLKALEKDPDERYQSAGDFVGDLRRWMQGEAIDARRHSGWYLMRMAARRHRAALASAALIAAVIVAGVVATVWQWRVAEQQRQRADQRFEDVRGLARALLFDTHDAIAELPGSRPAREQMVQTAIGYLERLAAESGDDPTLTLEIVEGYERVGDMLGSPSVPNLGDSAAALREYGRAMELLQPLLAPSTRAGAEIASSSAVHRSAGAAGGSEGAAGFVAERARQRSISLHNRIGAVLTVQGERERAIEHHERALALLRQGTDSGTGAASSARAATSDRAPSASNRADRGVEAATLMRIGEALAWSRDGEQALARFEASGAILEALAADADATDRDRHNLQVCLSKIGFMQGQLGRGEQALATQRRALEISRQLAAAQPENAARRRSVEINHNQVGAMLLGLGRADEAIEHFRAALSIGESLAAADPGNRLAQADLAFTRNKIGEALWMSSASEALPHFAAALEIRRSLAESDPANAEAQRGYAVACIKVGEARVRLANESGLADAARREHFAEARARYARALELLESMKDAGTLSEVDHALPDQLRGGIAECDALLAPPARGS